MIIIGTSRKRSREVVNVGLQEKKKKSAPTHDWWERFKWLFCKILDPALASFWRRVPFSSLYFKLDMQKVKANF